jgi:retron-type reverse transcriptase
VQHNQLLKQLEPIVDQSTLELFGKMIKAGYVDIHNLNDRERYTEALEGVPQGSLISPILSNLYLHPLDVHIVQDLLPKYNRGDSRRHNPAYGSRMEMSDIDREFLKAYPNAKEDVMRIKHYQSIQSGTITTNRRMDDPDFRRLYYARYADDFLLGFIGPKAEAVDIQNSIMEFLQEQLHLKSNADKSKLLHSSQTVEFLGARIR